MTHGHLPVPDFVDMKLRTDEAKDNDIINSLIFVKIISLSASRKFPASAQWSPIFIEPVWKLYPAWIYKHSQNILYFKPNFFWRKSVYVFWTRLRQFLDLPLTCKCRLVLNCARSVVLVVLIDVSYQTLGFYCGINCDVLDGKCCIWPWVLIYKDFCSILQKPSYRVNYRIRETNIKKLVAHP